MLKLVVTTSCLFATAAFGGSIHDNSKAMKWEDGVEPTHVLGPIHYVGTVGLSSWLIKTSEGLIILNSGMPTSGPMIEASIRKLGFDPKDVKLLLSGHAHIDHIGGHAHLKKISGATVAMIEQEVALTRSGGKDDFAYGSDLEMRFPAVEVDRVFKDGESIKLGDVEIKALLTAGHTRGTTTFVMDVKEGGKTFAVAFPDGTSINPGYSLDKKQSYPTIASDYKRTFDALSKLKPDVWLTPHPEFSDFHAKRARVSKDGVAALVDPDGYKEFIARKRQALDAALLP